MLTYDVCMPAPRDPVKYELWLARLRESHKGKRHSAETKAKIAASTSAAKTGVARPDMRGDGNPMRRAEVAEKVGAAHRGRAKPQAQRDKIAATLRGRRASETTRAKMQNPAAGYQAAHRRLDTTRGKIKTQTCEHCGSGAQHWALKTGRGFSGTWQGKLRRWSYDPADYLPLCIRCHRRYDAAARRDG